MQFSSKPAFMKRAAPTQVLRARLESMTPGGRSGGVPQFKRFSLAFWVGMALLGLSPPVRAQIAVLPETTMQAECN